MIQKQDLLQHQLASLFVRSIRSFVLTATVASILFVPAIGRAFSESNVVVWYECDETSGVRYDETSNSIDLTDNNTVGYGTGIQSNSCHFVNTNSEYFSVTDNAAFPTGSASWVFWLKHDTGFKNSDDDLWVKGDGTTNSWRILGSDNGIYLTLVSSGGSTYNSHFTGMTLTGNTWYQLAFTFDSTTAIATLYIDGTQYATSSITTTSIRDTAGSMYIGAWPTPTNYLDGELDMISLWNIKLSSTEVSELYNSGLGITYSDLFAATTSTTSTSTASTTSTVDVEELKWVLELYLSIFTFLIFTYIGYRFTKMFI